MNRELAEKIANTVLYEGYMLYPYRPSSLKNQQRWNFGTLYPPQYDEVSRGGERSSMHVECLVAGGAAEISVCARFLQTGTQPAQEHWDKAVERAVEFTVQRHDTAPPMTFALPGGTERFVSGAIHFHARELGSSLSKLTIELANQTPLAPSADRGQALLCALISAHIVLYAEGGEFISLLDPPDELRDAAAGCKNIGCFPVLVGAEGERDMLLCAPIILYDYPQIAPESAGDFFDGTETDEMLTLRVLTLTPEEKQAMREAEERVRALLERTEEGAREQLARIHGAVRSMRPIHEP